MTPFVRTGSSSGVRAGAGAGTGVTAGVTSPGAPNMSASREASSGAGGVWARADRTTRTHANTMPTPFILSPGSFPSPAGPAAAGAFLFRSLRHSAPS